MLYLCMSAAGSIPVLLCLMLWIFRKQSYPFQLGKKLLMIGMFFYLVPFQLVKYKLPESVNRHLCLPFTIHIEQNFSNAASIESVLNPGESIWIPKWICAVMLLWLACVVLFAVYEIVKYQIDIRKLMNESETIFADVDGKTVKLLTSEKVHTPYTVGFLRRSIIIPKGSEKHPCFSVVYRHEECHRKNYDSLMKLICIVIICVHWMNPVAYLLLPLYSVTAEYFCDAYAASGCTENEKKEYLRLIIGLSIKDEPLSAIWRSNLSGSGKLMKRRINYMMKREKTGKRKKGIAALVCAVTVFASASTIFAYEPFWSTDEESAIVLNEWETGDFKVERKASGLDFHDSDNVFIYEDGTISTIKSDESMYALCNHTMQSGYYYAHKSNGSGGCIVNEYSAKQCTKCGYTELGTLLSTTTYVVCPHT